MMYKMTLKRHELRLTKLYDHAATKNAHAIKSILFNNCIYEEPNGITSKFNSYYATIFKNIYNSFHQVKINRILSNIVSKSLPLINSSLLM